MMNRLVLGALVASGLGSALVLPNLSYAQATHTGIVERVWEDGLRLNTGERTLRVDTWDVYGDNTASYVSVGDEVTITGEFEGREFDAFSITGAAADSPAPAATDRPADDMTVSSRRSSTAYSGTVERVWEDGFQINTGERTLTVDTWDVYGDNTASYVSVGDRVTISGEFENGEFDAFTVRPTP
jgi:single-stranded DNA-binding protein